MYVDLVDSAAKEHPESLPDLARAVLTKMYDKGGC